MELEEILKKYIEAKKLLESNELLVSAGLVDFNETDALLARTTKADIELLARTTKADAILLARTTKADAEILAKVTETAANQLRENNKVSVRLMTWLTIAMLTVGFVQMVIAVMPIFHQ